MTYFQGTFEKRCTTTGAPTELSFVTTSLSILFIFTNIPGNLLIILAVFIDPHKNLRSPFNWLIANLAMADLIVGTITDPISVYIHMKEGLDQKLTVKEIWAIHISYFISCTASVLSISTLAVERYLAIQKPHAYRNEFTGKRIALTVAGIWFIALSLPMIYFEVGYITYAFIFANTSIVVAIGIICFTYSLMLRKFKERSHNLANQNNQTVASSSVPSTISFAIPAPASQLPSVSNSVANSARLMEAKLTKMFVVILVALLCCYGPSTIMIYIMSFCKSCSCTILHCLRDMQFVFVILNSSVNFYCYALQSPRFRNAFATILRLNRETRELRLSNINPGQSSTNNTSETSFGNSKPEDTTQGTTNQGLQF